MEEQNKTIPRRTIVLIVVLAVIVAIPLLYIFVVRPQDSDYTAASTEIDTLLSDAATIKSMNNNDALDPAIVTSLTLATDQLTVNGYNQALARLQQSPVITRDSTAGAYYKTIQAKVVNYGQSSSDMLATDKALASIKLNCNTLLSELPLTTTVAALTSDEAGCKSALAQYTSVPLGNFNKYYFQAYHGYVSDLVTALDSYYTAGSNGAKAQQNKAQADITAAITNIKKLNTSATYPIGNTANPSTELTNLKTVLAQRRTVFFR